MASRVGHQCSTTQKRPLKMPGKSFWPEALWPTTEEEWVVALGKIGNLCFGEFIRINS